MRRFTDPGRLRRFDRQSQSPAEHYHEASRLGAVVESLRQRRATTPAELEAPLAPPARPPAARRILLADGDRGTPTTAWLQLAERRRSARSFHAEPLGVDAIGRLLTEAYRVSGSLSLRGGTLRLRTAPSAGGLYPVETYLAASRVDGLRSGMYHYGVDDEALAEVTTAQDIPLRLQAICGGDPDAGAAAGALLLAARFARTGEKYGERGYRYVLMEAGHIAQLYCLAATQLGIGLLCRGAFHDDLAGRLVQLDRGAAAVVYILLFGRSGP